MNCLSFRSYSVYLLVIRSRVLLDPISSFVDTFGAKLSCCFCFNRKYWWPDPADPNVVKGYEQVASPHERNDIEPVARSLAGKESVRWVETM